MASHCGRRTTWLPNMAATITEAEEETLKVGKAAENLRAMVRTVGQVRREVLTFELECQTDLTGVEMDDLLEKAPEKKKSKKKKKGGDEEGRGQLRSLRKLLMQVRGLAFLMW